MVHLPDFETVDYTPAPGKLERKCITYIFRKILGGLPFALDFGDGDLRPMSDDPYEITMAPPRLRPLLSLLINPGLRFGEAFMDGSWYCKKGELSDLMLMLLSKDSAQTATNGLTFGLTEWLTHIYKQFFATFSATREVARHYDVNAEFFRLMIGHEMVYSCGFFENDGDDLATAQQRKFDTIFERLNLSAEKPLKVLDIGCGWGSFERYYPRDIEGQVDGISISEGQIAFARAHIDGITDKGKAQVNFIKQDYRFFCDDNPNAYDRIVSIGMLEHVGRSKYGHYFGAIRDVMAEDGVALVHSIIKREPTPTNLWFDRYIFPGGYAPTISEVVEGIEQSGLTLQAVHFHEGMNYVRTLQEWLKNLRTHHVECMQILIDEQTSGTDAEKLHRAQVTMRMFVYYLATVQTMFHPVLRGGGIAHFVVTP